MAELWKHGRRLGRKLLRHKYCACYNLTHHKKGGNAPQNKRGQIGKPPVLGQRKDHKKQKRCRQGPDQRRFGLRQSKGLKEAEQRPIQACQQQNRTAAKPERRHGETRLQLLPCSEGFGQLHSIPSSASPNMEIPSA